MARIAIVEDEYIVALNVERMLGRAGHECAGIFQSGEEFLSALDALPVDLALVDIRLGGKLDGLEVAARLDEERRVPVIFVTAYADAATIRKARETQPFGYILKPFGERDLVTAIELALYRSEMQAKLRESEERYRLLFERGPNAKFVVSSEGLVLERNAAFFELLGGDCAGSLEEFVVDPEARERLLRDDADRAGGFETCIRRKDGYAVPVELYGRNIASKDGRLKELHCEAIDLSERKQLENRLSQAARMESLGRLAGGLAHDFNNILTAILGYVHLLLAESGLGSSVRDAVLGIQRTSRRAADLTRQLLAFSKNRNARPSLVRLNEAGSDCEDMLRRLLPETIVLDSSWRAERDGVLVDQSQFAQILVNLVVNARDAMPNGGTIEIGTENRRIERETVLVSGELPAGDYCVLSVRDEGFGMDAETVSRVFEPFFTTKEGGKGTGLGLATVYGIVRSSNGGIDIESIPGKFSRFSVFMPLASGKDAENAESGEPETMAVADGSRLLLVEDDDDVRTPLSTLLRGRGYVVEACADAAAAERAIAGDSGFDALLTDINLPGIDGFEVAARFAARYPEAGVVFMSAIPGTERPPRWKEWPILAKPFDEDALFALVGKATGKSVGSGASERR